MRLLLGDCVEQMRGLEENSVDAIVCDPPYELGFMGKHWDNKGIAYSIEMWKDVLRVLKPGGHLLSFGGTRTYHRMACAIEDAGFEIRDCLQWLYGSGFPKSYNIGKGVDKKLVNEREIIIYDRYKDGNIRADQEEGKSIFDGRNTNKTTKGNSDWEGWGSGLKPACEPVVLARKPLSEKNLVENVLRWGTGGINIDASRISAGKEITDRISKGGNKNKSNAMNELKEVIYQGNLNGRFPANVLLDEEAARILDKQSGISKSCDVKRNRQTVGSFGMPNDATPEYSDKGGASRFFYVAKASKRERNEGLGENKCTHPTVKPVGLMEYLVRLVTPKGGVVLDPFMGSGTTGIACRNLGFDFVGIEKEEEYFEIAKARIGNQTTLKEVKE